MRKVKLLIFILLSQVLLIAGCTGNKKITVSGTVFDQNGKPVDNATVALFWSFEYGKFSPREWSGVLQTNEQGDFKGKMAISPSGATLFVMNRDKSLGAIQRISFTERENISITLEPLVTITGRCEMADYPIEKLDKFWIHFYKHSDIGFNRIQNGEIYFKLPPGDYNLGLEARQAENIRQPFTVPGDLLTFDLGTFNLEFNTIWSHVGKRPPEITVTDARGIDKNISWDSFKGKWILFEFWHYR